MSSAPRPDFSESLPSSSREPSGVAIAGPRRALHSHARMQSVVDPEVSAAAPSHARRAVLFVLGSLLGVVIAFATRVAPRIVQPKAMPAPVAVAAAAPPPPVVRVEPPPVVRAAPPLAHPRAAVPSVDVATLPHAAAPPHAAPVARTASAAVAPEPPGPKSTTPTRVNPASPDDAIMYPPPPRHEKASADDDEDEAERIGAADLANAHSLEKAMPR